MTIAEVRDNWQRVHQAAQKRGVRAANAVLVVMTHPRLAEPVEVVYTAFEWERAAKKSVGTRAQIAKEYRFTIHDGRDLWKRLRNSQEGLR